MDRQATWLFLFLTAMGLIFHPAGGERHSLTYIYTAFSKPVKLPGIHEFTAMGLLDGRMIDYYDSVNQTKIPKQRWMGERLDPDYWVKGTRSRQSKEQWFKVNIDILMKRMRQNDTDTHILQWRHGCEIDKSGDKSIFQRGMDMYSYDGNDFLSFNDADSNWIAPVDAAVPTKRKWDEVQVLKDYTKGYLEKECVEWLDKFLVYGAKALQKASPPEVYVFARTSKGNSKNMVLTCMATGFLPKDIIIDIKRNGRVVDKMDGLVSTGVRPNEDDTHQIRLTVEILQSDSADYICEVLHPATGMRAVKEWDHKVNCVSCTGGIIGSAIGGLLIGGLVVGGVVMYMYLKKKGPFANRGQDARNPTPPLTTTRADGDVGIYMNAETVPLAAAPPPTTPKADGDVGIYMNAETVPLTGPTKPNGDSDSGRGGSSDGSPDDSPKGSLKSAELV